MRDVHPPKCRCLGAELSNVIGIFLVWTMVISVGIKSKLTVLFEITDSQAIKHDRNGSYEQTAANCKTELLEL